jgi:hypothetical protein
MPTPPPSPRPPSRAPAPRDAAHGFVTGVAWITIALGALGVGLGLLEMLPSASMTPDDVQRLLDPLGTGQVQLPPMLRWTMAHDLQISLVEILLAAPMLWLGWGLLRRREWARVGYIVSLVIGALMTFGLIWLVPALFDAVLSMQPGLQAPGQALPPELAGIRTVATAFSAIIAVVFAALHAAIAWKLCTPAVRAQFESVS